jgi:hypothetical protein
MKKLNLIFRLFSGALASLVALVFTVFEAALLVTLDFMLYENELIAFFQLFFKLLLALSALMLGVFSIVKIRRPFLPESLALFAAAAVIAPFVSNGFGIYFIALAVLFALSQLLFAMQGKEK